MTERIQITGTVLVTALATSSMSMEVKWHPQLVGRLGRCTESFLHIRLGPQGNETRIGETIIWYTSYSYSGVQYSLRSVR
jgi:hypothetical protein